VHVVANAVEPHVREFCTSIAMGAEAVRVPCRPLTDAPLNECFSILPEHVASHGGSQVIGWAVWERPGVFIEAEFHAVWCSPDGELMDIVPRARLFDEILFLPDAARPYTGRQVDNMRRALVSDNDVKRFLFLFHRQFEILNTGALATQHGLISLPKRAAKELEGLQKELGRLQNRINKRYGS